MEKLFKVLSEQGKYTKSLEDFQTQFGSIEGQKKLYGALESSGDYTKSFEDFSNQFFSSDLAKINDSASADPTVESSVTGFKSEDGSSEPRDASDFANTQEENTWLEDYFGKNALTDFIGDIYRAGSAGLTAGTSVDESFDLYKKGKDMTDAELNAFLTKTREVEKSGRTDEMIALTEKQNQLKKEGYNGVSAFFLGWWDNPSAMLQYSVQSLVQMGAALVDSEEVLGTAAAASGAGALAGGATGATGFVAGPLGAATTVGGALTGTAAGFFGGLSGAMEVGMTTAQLMQEQAEKEGYAWSDMSDKERFNYVRKLTNDTEKFGELKSNAVARGIAIGSIDALTAGLTAGVGGAAYKGVASGARSAFAGAAKTAAIAGVETAGGMLSEVAGQAAANQEFNLEEILIEGFADKTFTGVSIVESAVKGGPKYSINGEKMNGKKFIDNIKILDDEAFVTRAIKVENSPAVSKLISDRRQNIAADQNVDSRINNVEDRTNAINLVKEKNKLEGNADGNKTRLIQIKAELDEISKKYENSEVDVTIEERKQAVANAVDTVFEAEFNKNYKALKYKQKDTGIEPVIFEDDNLFAETAANDLNVTKEYIIENAPDGVFVGKGKVYINKNQAKKSINIATGNNGAISVTSHEVLHPIFNALIGGKKSQGQFVKQFKKQMTSKQKAYVNKRLKSAYKDQPGAEAYELMNIFSDGIIKNDISYDRTTFEKLGDSITSLFRSAIGLKTNEISFEDGRGVFNFLKEYNTSIKAGKLSDKAISAIKEAETKKKTTVAKAKLLGKTQFSISVEQAEANLQAAEDADPNDPSYLDNLEKAEIALEEAEEAAKAPKPSPEPVVKKEVKPKVKVARPEKPKRTTDLGPRDPISKKIMSTYDEGMEGVDRPDYKANKPLPASLERKLIPLFEGYINTIVQQKFKQASPEALEFQDALSILRAEVSNAIRTFNPAKNKDLAGYVKKIVQTRQSLMFKDASKEFTSDIEGDAAKGVVATEDEVSVDRSGAVERGQATFDQLEVVDDALIEDISKELEKEIRVRTQKGTLSEARKVTQKVKGKSYETLVPWIEDYVEKTLFKKLSKKLGAVGQTKDKVTGEQKTRIPGPYIDFLNDENTFDIITKALPIKTLKSSYSKLFKVTKIGREKTAEGNPIFKVEPTTPKAFLQYFLDGKYGTLLARQKQLFREILRPVAKEVVADYATPENLIELKSIQELAPAESIDAIENIVLDTQLANLESQLDRYKGEERSFDVIQFSKEIDSNAPNVTNELLSLAALNASTTLLKDSSQGKQKFYIDRLEKYYETREEFMRFLPPSITKFRTLAASILGFVYREDGSYYDFYKYNYKKAVNEKGETIIDKKRLNDLFKRGKASFKNKLFDSKGNVSEYSNTTKSLIKEVNKLIKEANLGRLTPNLHSGRVAAAKAKLNKNIIIEAALAQGVLNHLSKNNTLNTKIAELYISLLRDFVKASKNKKQAKAAVVNMLLATSNTVNGWRSLAFISSIIYNKNKVTDYYFEHNDSMKTVLPIILAQILGEGPISFKVDSSLIPVDLANTKNKKQKTKVGNKLVTDEFYKKELSKDKNLEIVTIQLSKSEGPSVDIYHGGNIQKTGDIKGIVYFSEDKAQAAEYAKGNYGEVKNFVIKAENVVSEEKVFEVIEKLGIQPKTKGYKVDELNLYELIDLRFEQESFSKKDLSRLTKALKKKGIKASRFTDTDLKTGKDTSNVVVFDKSVIQESDIQFSKGMNEVFNDMIEGATGIETYKRFSKAKGKVRGRNKGRFKFFIPPSADDFAGLLYRLLGKKEQGNLDSAWFKEKLFDPFAKGIRDFEAYKQRATKIVAKLKKDIKNIPSGLSKINETGFTNEQAVRVYLWVKNGHDIDGLTATDQKELIKIVNDSPALKRFAEEVDIALQGYPEPNKEWLAGSITTDAINMVNTAKRAEFLKEWQANADLIFSEQNLNKLRAAYGDNYVEALKDMLYRMKTGRNRPSGANKLTNKFMNWVNDSVGTIMFFNTRSALLQTLSIANFINWGDNNPAKAAMAFANQKQFWADFAMLFNSDFLKQRRSGLKTDVNADDIASAAETSTNKAKAVLASMLKMGFLPTQMADSFAIAMGGASFIRNRINALKKEGMTEAEATDKAFLDFQEIAEETQQSSRPDRISQQQASPLGRIILAFANTPMQYMRLTKKAFLDLKNGRGDKRTNISKIAYYMFVQNIIFSALQTALFSALFDDDEEELDKKEIRIANSMLDSILRGVGVYGAIASTGKNIYLEIDKQSKKPKPDFTQAAIRSLDLSPPISSKIRKLMSAGRAFSFKTTREKMVGFDLDNPAIYAGGQIVSALTNIPLDRAIKKADNLRTAVDNDTKFWQSVALALGYSKWDLGLVETSKTKGKKSKFGVTSSWKRPVKKRKFKRGE